ncbi:hypothetical protein ACHAW5_007858 [Stephanodiscus triporus]|uniref:Uncharacterized protein n=1 Tax=Stephanodiscus triporus TaxID=2934178 RepID=A0ABD3P0U9_9STRA
MADSLPKVSVVTRGDKCTEHYNLVESFLAIIYLYYVIKNLFWFSPLKEREDFSKLLLWFESRAALFQR